MTIILFCLLRTDIKTIKTGLLKVYGFLVIIFLNVTYFPCLNVTSPALFLISFIFFVVH